MMDNQNRVKGASCTSEELDELEASLSRERLEIYLAAARGDRAKAVRLHAWNTAVSAAFYGPLQGLEVTLRNAVHRELVKRYGPSWHDNPDTGLDKVALARVSDAKSKLSRGDHEAETSRLVAILSFGFWVSLVGPGGRLVSGRKADYQMTLWRPALRRVFLHREKLTRKQAHGPLNDLRILRNRIAHHEPIFDRNLIEDHDRILELIGWMSPGTATWIERHSEVCDLLTLFGEAEGKKDRAPRDAGR